MSRQLLASSFRVEGASTFVGNVSSTVVGANEVQTLQVTGTPTGGSFVLQFLGYSITLVYNSAVATTQAAFDAALGAGSVTVAGAGAFPANAQTITFSPGIWTGMDVPSMSLVTNSLTGGTTPSVTITPTSAGGGNFIVNDASVTTLNAGSIMSTNLFASNVRLYGTSTPLVISPTGNGIIGITINPSLHTTSKRASMVMGSWQIGQDLNLNGTLDFFWHNGATRLVMDPSGQLTLFNGAQITAAGGAYRTRITGGTGFTTKHVELGELFTAGGLYGSSGDLHIVAAGSAIRMTASSNDPSSRSFRITGAGDAGAMAGSNANAGIIFTQRNGGTGGLGPASSNNYYDASFYAGPGDVAESQVSKTASIAFHPGGVAPQLRVGYGDSNIYNRASDGTTNNPFTASAFTVASTRRIKKNISTWPSPSLSAAGESASDRLRKLRVVTFDRDEPVLAQLPSGRRLEAWKRLNSYTTRNGFDPYVLREHDCSLDECNGTADDPCSRVLNARHSEYGLIAEEVFEVVPEAVVLDVDRQPYSLNYSMLQAMEIAAIQEIVQRLERVEASIG